MRPDRFRSGRVHSAEDKTQRQKLLRKGIARASETQDATKLVQSGSSPHIRHSPGMNSPKSRRHRVEAQLPSRPTAAEVEPEYAARLGVPMKKQGTDCFRQFEPPHSETAFVTGNPTATGTTDGDAITCRCCGAGFQPARQFARSLHVCAELKNTFPAGQVENLPHDMRVREVIADPFLRACLGEPIVWLLRNVPA